ncbi:MAG TPA: hypothetical protein VFO40_16990 [Chthoniobacterales bacterium]|nr:hypothetical protein [Chthoniobacterales bacterium]
MPPKHFRPRGDRSSQEANDEEDYLATGFRNVASAKTEKMIRSLDALQSMVCFQRYKDRSPELLRGSDNSGAAYERTSLRG